jgi:thymidylate kinase
MIAFSGLDSAGKSTQIRLLKDYFSQANKKVEVFWSRGGYTPGMELLKSILRRLKSPGIPNKSGPSKERDKAFSNKHLKKAWLTLAILDLIWFYGIVLRWKSFKKIVICDRYLLDTEIDFEWSFPEDKVVEWWLWKLLAIVALKPKHHFLLTISIEESIRRSHFKEEPFPDTPEVLQYRLSKYLEFSNLKQSCYRLDGLQPVNKVAEQIKDVLSI